MAKYRKFIVALSGLLAVAATVLSDGVVLPTEYEAIGAAIISAVLVFLVPNEPAA